MKEIRLFFVLLILISICGIIYYFYQLENKKTVSFGTNNPICVKYDYFVKYPTKIKSLSIDPANFGDFDETLILKLVNLEKLYIAYYSDINKINKILYNLKKMNSLHTLCIHGIKSPEIDLNIIINKNIKELVLRFSNLNNLTITKIENSKLEKLKLLNCDLNSISYNINNFKRLSLLKIESVPFECFNDSLVNSETLKDFEISFTNKINNKYFFKSLGKLKKLETLYYYDKDTSEKYQIPDEIKYLNNIKNLQVKNYVIKVSNELYNLKNLKSISFIISENILYDSIFWSNLKAKNIKFIGNPTSLY